MQSTMRGEWTRMIGGVQTPSQGSAFGKGMGVSMEEMGHPKWAVMQDSVPRNELQAFLVRDVRRLVGAASNNCTGVGIGSQSAPATADAESLQRRLGQ